jgi:hypothetical protein
MVCVSFAERSLAGAGAIDKMFKIYPREPPESRTPKHFAKVVHRLLYRTFTITVVPTHQLHLHARHDLHGRIPGQAEDWETSRRRFGMFRVEIAEAVHDEFRERQFGMLDSGHDEFRLEIAAISPDERERAERFGASDVLTLECE